MSVGVVSRRIDISESEVVIRCGGGERESEGVSAKVRVEHSENSGVPGRQDSTTRTIRRNGDVSFELRQQEGANFSRSRIV